MYNYCKTCYHDDGDIGFCDKCLYNHDLEEKGIQPTEYKAKPNPITNADNIHTMSDKELDGFISRIHVNGKTYGLKCEIVEARPVTCKKCGASFRLKYGEGQCEHCGTYYTTHFYIEEHD